MPVSSRECKPSDKKMKIAAVVGPTASGKTALSIALAERFGCEIISCDSMQLYRGMDIGTAKPTTDETRGIKHHLIDIINPDEDFSSTDYSLRAAKCVNDITSRGKLPLFCGGTGLYLDSFLRGVRDDGAVSCPEFREEMSRAAVKYGALYIHEKLAEVDPASAASIHPNNIKRVIRALEVFHATGKTKTELDAMSTEKVSPYNPIVIGLRFRDREKLYERIDRRVDIMFENGLTDEVKSLLDKGYLSEDTTAGQAIGYKELVRYVNGNISLDEATEAIKIASRHYAKRQMTWFNAKKYVKWIDADDNLIRTFEDIVNIASNLFIENGIGGIINK